MPCLAIYLVDPDPNPDPCTDFTTLPQTLQITVDLSGSHWTVSDLVTATKPVLLSLTGG